MKTNRYLSIRPTARNSRAYRGAAQGGFIRTALAALLIATAAACSDDAPNDVPTPGTDDIDTPATDLVTVRFGSGDDNAKPETRTTLDGNDVLWATTDEIGIIAQKKGTSTATVDNKKYNPAAAAKSSAFTPADNSEMQLEADTYTFYSYYPYQKDDVYEYEMDYRLNDLVQDINDPNKHITDKDLMYACVSGVEVQADSDPKVTFTYDHAFTLLRITNNTGKALTRIVVLSTGNSAVAGRPRINLQDKSWEFMDDTQKSRSISLTFKGDQSLADGGTGSLLIIPQESGGPDLIISAIAEDGTIYEISKALPQGGLTAGNIYTIDFSPANGVKTHSKPATGSGGYQIGTESDLRWLALAVSYYGETFVDATLTTNITLQDYKNWEPIGTEKHPYNGTFDGDGKTVSNLDINRTSGNYIGFFGYIDGATVSNLHVKGSITAENSNFVGGIAGYAKNSNISNCLFSEGTLKGSGNVGGIVGFSRGTTITGCFASGNMEATINVAGGIVGSNQSSSSLTNCYSNANVTVKFNGAGGIVGTNNSTIENCYATGKITASEQTGGIVGWNYNNGKVTNCLALGTEIVRSSGSAEETFGRIAGKTNNNDNISGCAAWENMTLPVTISEAESGKDGVNLTTADCKKQDTYTSRGFDATVWSFDDQWQSLPWIKAFETFSGINEADYRIAIPDHLEPVVP